MAAPLDCPGIECWRALFEGAAAPEGRADYERHLESCPVCQARLDRAGAEGDRLLTVVRQIGGAPAAAAGPALARVLRRLHEEAPPAGPGPAEPADLDFLCPSDRPGVVGTLGEYEVRELLGQGGMGIVLKAFEPALQRLVAIKVLSPGLAGSALARRRFTREARAAAAVCHEHVVPVYGVAAAAGLPYLVMQYVPGQSLQARLDRAGPLPVQDVVRIGLQAASGLAAAHAQGLIHRDVKPANLLLEDGLARVKVTDFGLARLADDAGLTQQGVVAGTPEYMAPEQARGEAVDHRADLYGLGATLYACSTGTPPFRAATTLAVLRRVSDEAPVPLRSLNPDVPAWLEALIGRLLAKDPAERFGSAAEVAALLEGYLAHLRDRATVPAPELPPPPPPDGAPSRRWRPRTWLPILVALVVLGPVLALRITAGGGPPAGAPPAPPQPADGEVDQTIRALTFSPDGQRLATAGGDHALPGQLQIWDVATGKPLWTRRLDPAARAAAYSPDGQLLATGHWGGAIKLRDPHSGAERAELTGHDMGVNALAFAADGRLLASAGLDKTARLWDVRARQEKQVFAGHTDMVLGVAFFHHRRAIVTASRDRTARVWDQDTGKELFAFRGHGNAVETVAVAPDDRVVATGSWDHHIKFWDAETGQELADLPHHYGNVQSLAFSPDGRLLASAGSNGTIRLWDVASQMQLVTLPPHQGIAWAVAFSPDGKLLASAGDDRVARLWDLAGNHEAATLSAVGAVPSPEESPAPAPRAVSKGWTAAALVVFGLLLVLALAVWLVARHGRRAGVAPAPGAVGGEQARPSPAAAAVPFPCPGCGRQLRAGAELAGKKVKCPKCGKAVLVPGAPAGESARLP